MVPVKQSARKFRGEITELQLSHRALSRTTLGLVCVFFVSRAVVFSLPSLPGLPPGFGWASSNVG